MSPGARIELVSVRSDLLGLRRDVVGRPIGALAEEVLLRLLVHQPLPLLGRQVEPVFVVDHLRELEPAFPRLERDAVVDALPELIVERLVGHRRQLLPELRALDHSRHGFSSNLQLKDMSCFAPWRNGRKVMVRARGRKRGSASRAERRDAGKGSSCAPPSSRRPSFCSSRRRPSWPRSPSRYAPTAARCSRAIASRWAATR